MSVLAAMAARGRFASGVVTPPDPEPSSAPFVTVSRPQFGLNPTMTETLTAFVVDENDAEVVTPVVWSSSDSGVATVNSVSGEVAAIAKGRCTITATHGLVTGHSIVDVDPAFTFHRGAELPRVVPFMPAIAWDNTITVAIDGSDLKAKITSAAAMAGNTAVVIPNGTTCGWNVDWRVVAKSGDGLGGWVGIMSASYYAGTFPAIHEDSDYALGIDLDRRYDPALDSAHVATVAFSNTTGFLCNRGGRDCNRYLFLGLRVTHVMSDAKTQNGYFDLASGEETDATDLPHHFVIRHCHLDAPLTGKTKRGVNLNSGWALIQHNRFDNIGYYGNGDAGDIGGANGTGPYRYDNNYFGGAGINVFYGGDRSRTRVMPGDFTITRNLIEKPLRYNFHDPDNYEGVRKSSKNLLEIKMGLRWNIRGNILRNSWVDGQSGSGLLIKTVSQNTEIGTTYETGDVIVRDNQVLNVCTALETSDRGAHGATKTKLNVVPVHHMVLENNVLEIGDKTKLTDGVVPSGIFLFPDAGAPEMARFRYPWGPQHMIHNTFVKRPTAQKMRCVLLFGKSSTRQPYGMRSEISDNIFDHDASYGIVVDGEDDGPKMLTRKGVVALNNTWGKSIVGMTQSLFNADPLLVTNRVLAARDDIKFVDRDGGDYRLASDSTTKGTASDSGDPGAGIDVVDYETRGCITGVWS